MSAPEKPFTPATVYRILKNHVDRCETLMKAHENGHRQYMDAERERAETVVFMEALGLKL